MTDVIAVEKIAKIYRALSDETRLRIANILHNKNLCVNRITEVLGVRQSKVSRHLNYLKTAGLVKSEKIGLRVYYTLSKDGISYSIVKSFKELRKGVRELDIDIRKASKRTCC
ncbi:MAG: hypothetical protein A2073_06015 [Deltaproteobacteria bacterium GWC2_42_11]|nr:MAG: hypothetical protein A2073_06015 [Deltaproteobacteria bacterium GWC2_42_11]HBO83984.1 transcriptional regulator [Deltaproteobacteria bacterium]